MPLKFFSIEFTKGNEERLKEDSVLNFRYNSSSEGNYASEKKAQTLHRCQLLWSYPLDSEQDIFIKDSHQWTNASLGIIFPILITIQINYISVWH